MTSSAGASAVTDDDGCYHIEARIPIEATQVRITATDGHGAGLIASVDVPLDGVTSSAAVGSLWLSAGPSCVPAWEGTFGGWPGANSTVWAMTTFDDGGGPTLYIGGQFGFPAPRIFRWDGAYATPLSGGTDGTVLAMAVFDDGGGEALFVGGDFITAGGVVVNRVARWDGSTWTPLDSGTNATVRALCVYDDGGGPALYAGGDFTTAGGVTVRHVAKWDGSSWTDVGGGLTGGNVNALAAFESGGVPRLYAGGTFTNIFGGATASRMARWDGSTWSAVGSGVVGSFVNALVVHDDGGGPDLYVGGQFGSAGGNTDCNNVARFNGTSWSALGTGVGSTVSTLTGYDDGAGADLYVGGQFTSASGTPANFIARWTRGAGGGSWSVLSGGLESSVRSLAVFDDGGGQALYVGGQFDEADGMRADRLARWDGSAWSPIGRGLNEDVRCLAEFDDGGGTALYAAGTFTAAGGSQASRIARWDGSSWTSLGTGISGAPFTVVSVNDLAVFDDGGGPDLYVGGAFSAGDGVPAANIARWDGTAFSALGAGLPSSALTLETFDDGGGPDLYVGGSFTTAGGVPAGRIARWDGSTWTSLGGGVTSGSSISDLAVFDDGGGPDLYAIGSFSAVDGVSAANVARWDGTAWSALGTGLSSSGRALAVFDDGGGPDLYAGGVFTSAGGVATLRIARWDGSTWSAVGGTGMGDTVEALFPFDDGTGPALYAGGRFTSADGLVVNHVAAWDGASWSPLGGGMGSIGLNETFGTVYALASFDDGTGSRLHVGGDYLFTFDSRDAFLAKWSCVIDSEPPVLTCPEEVVVLDELGSPPGEVVDFVVTASDALDPDPVIVCAPSSGSVFPRGTTMVTCTATDASGNQSTCQFPVTVELKARRHSSP